jgi:hypothetical protein
VFGRADGTPLQLSLEEEGIDDIFYLINIDSPTINNLQYTNSNNNNATTNVRTVDTMLQKCFLRSIGARHNEGNPVGNDWDQITQVELDSFIFTPSTSFTSHPNLHIHHL